MERPPKQLVDLAWDFRVEMENNAYDIPWNSITDERKLQDVFNGDCCYYSRKFLKALKKEGFNAVVCYGYYLNISPFYFPADIRNQMEPEDWEIYEEIGFFPNWRHFWVMVDGKWFVDLTVDQFHPDDPLMYRLVIAPVGHPDYLVDETYDT